MYPLWAATTFVIILIVIALSAVASASSYLKSISFCPKATSWWEISISIPNCSAVSAISRLMPSVKSPGWKSKYPAKSIGVGNSESFSFTMKNSCSGAQMYVKPSSLAFFKARSRMYRGSPLKRVPSGVYTSQISLHDDFSFARHGKTANVVGSGNRTISDSSIGLYPVIDDPSKGWPFSKIASMFLDDTAKFFTMPLMSVN